ncbi:hypothetical protein BGZ60DRAFT_398892 [Tricladium varicosporioides]|nr:hypothetical protein BGZ60DRAFT_398892 [Hymenoscyphus varicosporioides]
MVASAMSIVLSSPPGPLHIVTSDQVISGKVIFSNQRDRPTGVVTISLLGKSETLFKKGKSVYQGSATLFRLSKTLHDGALSQNQYEWPFEFTFPKVTAGEKKKWLAIPPYQVTESHQLPISMAFDAEDFENNIGRGIIIYMLETQFTKSGNPSSFGKSESARLALYYIPYRDSKTPSPHISPLGKETFTCSSKLLDTTSEKPKSFLKRFTTPRSVFEVSISAPTVLYAGGSLPITLSLTHDLQTSTAPAVPTVRLTSCSIMLIRTMHAAGRAMFEDDGKFSIVENLLVKENLDIPLSESQDLSEILDLGSFRTRFGMGFATYNMAQTFKIMVKVTLGCVDKRFWTELRSRNILVVSPFTREALEFELQKGGGGEVATLLKGLNDIGEGLDVDFLKMDALAGILGAAGVAASFM